MALSLQQYAADRASIRYKQRGDLMTLRRITLLPGTPPYPNPPQVSADLVIRTAIDGTHGLGLSYFGIYGSSVIGRLTPGDQVIIAGQPVWTVVAMPANVQTDADGIAMANPDGSPLWLAQAPATWQTDTLAGTENPALPWPVVPVSAPGAPSCTSAFGLPASFIFRADEPIYGNSMNQQKMVEAGWIEGNDVGFEIAAYDRFNKVARPRTDDQVMTSDGFVYSIVSVNEQSRANVSQLYALRCK